MTGGMGGLPSSILRSCGPRFSAGRASSPCRPALVDHERVADRDRVADEPARGSPGRSSTGARIGLGTDLICASKDQEPFRRSFLDRPNDRSVEPKPNRLAVAACIPTRRGRTTPQDAVSRSSFALNTAFMRATQSLGQSTDERSALNVNPDADRARSPKLLQGQCSAWVTRTRRPEDNNKTDPQSLIGDRFNHLGSDRADPIGSTARALHSRSRRLRTPCEWGGA